MRIVFMGTPQYAASILDELARVHEVVAVYTRADAVRGRGKKLVASPVKQVAERWGIPVRTPRTLRDEQVQDELRALAPDAICVAAYGLLLPKEVLDIPQYGCINAHASLLPRWRGAAPVERAILAGDQETGVCIMLMEEGLDTGPYNICRSTPISTYPAQQLTDELADLGAQGLITALALIESGRPGWIEQPNEGVTYAEKVRKEELLPCIKDTAQTFARKVQASGETHPARCLIGGKGVSVLRAAVLSEDAARELDITNLQPGAVCFVAKRLFLGCADGVVELLELKPDGKQAMEARAFAAGVQGIKAGGVMWEAWHAA